MEIRSEDPCKHSCIHGFSPPIFSGVSDKLGSCDKPPSLCNYQLWKQSGVQMFEERDDNGRLMHRRRFAGQLTAITAAAVLSEDHVLVLGDKGRRPLQTLVW